MEWREIEGEPGYFVSSTGAVKGPRGFLKLRLESGYMRVKFAGKQHYVHCLVAAAFIGPRPTGLIIRHRNCHVGDNRVENLHYTDRRAPDSIAEWLKLLKPKENNVG